MAERLPALIFGLLLIIGGAVMIFMHVRSWRSHCADETLSTHDRQYFRRQFRRRIQVSGLVVLIGIMLPIGDLESPWKRHPGWWTVYIMIVLGLAVWIMFLACGDLISTRSYSRTALSQLREQQRALEEEAARLKARSAGTRADS